MAVLLHQSLAGYISYKGNLFYLSNPKWRNQSTAIQVIPLNNQHQEILWSSHLSVNVPLSG